MFNIKISKGEYMWYGGETSLTLQPLLWVPSHMASTNQLINSLKTNLLYGTLDHTMTQ